MIDSLTGLILEKGPGEVVVECGGVGYAVAIPSTAAGALPAVGARATVYTHMNVSENDVSLYGFADRESRAMFRMLTGVSGVGPKVGVAILSALSSADIVLAVSAGDFKTLTVASGVGPKLAQRIVLELKDKLGAAFTALPGAPQGGAVAPGAGAVQQAAVALAGLGYSPSEAAKAISGIDPALPAAEIIRLALMELGKAKQ